MKIDPSKKYVTVSGHNARIICTTKKGDYPIVALVESGKKWGSDEAHEEIAYSYNNEGHYCGAITAYNATTGKYEHSQHPLDLVEPPVMMSKYTNVYTDITGAYYDTPEDAKRNAGKDNHAGLIKVDFVNGKLSNVTVL
jgi:hypothetical protein